MGTPSVAMKAGWRDMLYLSPFFLALVATTISIKQGQWIDVTVQSFQQGDPARPYVFGPIYLAALLLLLYRATDALKRMRRHLPYLFFLLYALATIGWTWHPAKVVTYSGHMVGSYMVCMCAALAINYRERLLFRVLMLFSTLLLLMTLVTVALVPSRGIMEVGDKLRWVGLAPNANTLGMALLLVVWVGLVRFFYEDGAAARCGSVVLIALAAVCLYGTDSMTSSLLSLLMAVFLPLLMVVGRRPPLAAALGVFFSTSIFSVVSLTAYLFRPDLFLTEKFFTTIGRTSTFTGRTGLWKIAVQAIRERPLLGWSFDARLSVSDKYLFHAGHFHNGYLELLVAGGMVGLGFMTAVLAQTMFHLLRMLARNRSLFAAYSVLLLVIMLHNITEASLATSPHVFWLMFTLLYMEITGSPSITTRRAAPDEASAEGVA
jgi:O-antigen ligase